MPFVLVGLMFAFTFQLSAQEPERDQDRPGGRGGPGGARRGYQTTEEDISERADHLAATLELTEQQHKKIVDYDLEFYTKMQVEREKHMGDREAMRAAMMEARDQRNRKYEEVLTKEQMDKFLEIQEQRREQMRQQRQQNNSGGEEERPARGRSRD